MSNPRPLSDQEYVAFLTEVQPDYLPLPAYGGIAQWEGRYILMFKDARGEWRLTDISGGVPWKDQTISAHDITANLERQVQDGVVFWGLASGFAEGVGNIAHAIGYTVGWTAAEMNAGVQSVSTAVGQAAGGILAPSLSGLTIPLIAIGIAALLIYLPKGRA